MSKLLHVCIWHYNLSRISTSSWGSLYMVFRGPMPSIISRRCFFSIIFLGDSAPVNSSKELENTIKWGWCLHSETLLQSFQNKQGYLSESGNALVERRRKQICRCFWHCKYMLKFHWIIKMVKKCYKALNRKAFIVMSYLTKFAVQFIPTSPSFVFTENSYSYRSNNFAFACSVPIVYSYGYLCRK